MALSLAPAFHCPAPLARLRPASVTATTTRPAVSRPSTPPPILRQGIAAEPGALCSNALQCQHFQQCSGCSHETALDCPPLLSEAKKFFVRHGISDLSFDSGLLWGWRCRAKLAVRGSAKEPMVGLYEEGSHNVVDIPFCKAHHPSINAAVELLKQGIALFNVQPYDEDSGTGELRYVQMAVTTYDTSVPASERYLKGKVQISLVWNSRSEKSPGVEKADALSGFLWRKGGQNSSYHLIHSVWMNFQTSSTNVIFGHRWRHMIGEKDLWEHVGGIDISLAPSSFGQANTKAFDSLLHKLQKYVPVGENVVDLYAGAGVIGLSLAVTRNCRTVKCLEVNKEAKLSFERSISRLPKSFSGNISWHHTDVAMEPLYWLEGSDVVVVDPPRKGLHPSLIEALQKLPSSSKKAVQMTGSSSTRKREEKRPWVLQAREACAELNNSSIDKGQSWPHTIIYISCGWESFKKDCDSLVSSKIWRLEKAHAFNFFPGTKSIEILAVFKRGGLSSQKEKKKKKAGKRKGSSKERSL
ncbi:uncharacterized protein LOC116248149 isoform X1 [Nymphaea colorata]|nr:uncharacterized protein LOC116248149 isoform X1 [Nymphaea colorata]XP_031476634.1 uncharacterized protein LOC116248149 isoform X1 [Nymphaea colorata]XP_031476636.1 uncharacterized protein LOC116248149 isoform X1 [Nymphaea colorata]